MINYNIFVGHVTITGRISKIVEYITELSVMQSTNSIRHEKDKAPLHYSTFNNTAEFPFTTHKNINSSKVCVKTKHAWF